jgi:hypothetical protein
VKIQTATVTRNHLHNARKHVKFHTSSFCYRIPASTIGQFSHTCRTTSQSTSFAASVSRCYSSRMAVGVRGEYNSSFTNLKKPKGKGVGSEERGSMESVLHAQSICQETIPWNRHGPLYGSVVVGHLLQARYQVIFVSQRQQIWWTVIRCGEYGRYWDSVSTSAA